MLPVTLCSNHVSHALHALVDSRAEQNLIDFALAERLHLPLIALDSPIPVTALNGQMFSQITHQTGPLTLLTSGNHRETITLHTVASPDSPLILGYPWLQRHNPHIDWSGDKVASWSLFCLAHCLTSALPPGGPGPSSVDSAAPDLTGVPSEYHDLRDVFSKTRAQSLPPHRPYDCTIDLLPGAPLPSSRLFNISRPEREAMEKYIRESLEAGIIRPSSSPVGAGFFFVEKKDKSLRPCIDYRGLNSITVKNSYPLPLISSAF